MNIIPKNGTEVAVEILETAITDLAVGMRKLNASRLKRDAVVTLLHANSRVGKRDIELILNNLEQLDRTWLKPKAVVAK